MVPSGASGRTVIGMSVVAVLFCGGLFLGASRRSAGAEPVEAPPVIPLWPQGAPGAKGTDPEKDIPTITVWLARPETATGAAVVVCPGGGYGMLAVEHEGKQIAEWLNTMGIAAFVLKYRLGPRYHHPIELGDAQRAIRLLRLHADEWHLAPDRIGIIGFSAGGHLAASLSTHFDSGNADAADMVDRAGSRPDFAILAYPVISMTEPWTHAGSRKNLLGDQPDPEVAKNLSLETAVTPRTPPTFIFQTNADTTVPAENAVYYFLALRKAGVPAELHLFENGRHGVGLAMDDPALSEWPALLANWLRARGLLKK